MAKYRKIYPRIWDSLEFRQLTPDEKLLCFNVLTGTQGNRVGCFVYRVSIAAEETGLESVGTLLDSLCRKMGWVYESTTRVLWIPSWFDWNPPESRDALYGYISDLTELPKLETADRLYNSLSDSLLEYDKIKDSGAVGQKKFSAIWADLYGKARQSVPQPVPHQEQKQKHEQLQNQDHKQNIHAPRSTERNAVPDDLFLTYPCNGPVKEYHLSMSQVKEWSELYEGLDIQFECKKALAWIKANSKRKKTARGMPTFLVGWLGRANNKGGMVAPEQTTDSGDASAAWAIVHKRICGRKLDEGETTETPRIIHAVNIAGGWPYLRSINTDQVAYARRDFIAAYHNYQESSK